MAAAFLTDTLTNRFKGQRLSHPEEEILLRLPWTIGLLARHHDEAFGFLQQVLAPDFWEGHYAWESSNPEDVPRALTTMTLYGLASSGRQEVVALLRALREPGSVVIRWGLASTLASAAFRLRVALDQPARYHAGEVL